MKRLSETGRALVLPADISIPDAYILGYNESKEEYISEFLADLKEIRGLFNIIKNHKSYNGIIEKWEKRQ